MLAETQECRSDELYGVGVRGHGEEGLIIFYPPRMTSKDLNELVMFTSPHTHLCCIQEQA